MTDAPVIWSAEGSATPPGAGGTPPGAGAPPPGAGGPPPGAGAPPPPPPPGTGAPPPPPSAPTRDGPAWERRAAAIDLAAMFTTVRDVLFDAPRTFRTMVRDAGLGGPIAYYLILGTVFGWIGLVWDAAFESVTGGLGGFPFGGDQLEQYQLLMASGLFRIVTAVILPALLLVTLVIWSGILHLLLLLLGGARFPFETTMRVVCYSSGSTALFQAVPLCGGLIGGIWSLVVTMIGLAEAHETSYGKGVAAVLLPFLFCCLCLVAAGVIIAVMAGGFAGL